MPVTTLTTIKDFVDYYTEHPDELDQLSQTNPALALRIKAFMNTQAAVDNYKSGNGTAQDILYAYGVAGNNGLHMTPEMEKWLDNEISRENTAADNQFQQEMRDTSITSSANQLSALGLSPSNVISVGGAASGVTSNAASINRHSAASLHQQERINDYNQKMGMAKSLISTAGSMASSGIYGAALGAVRHSASALATQAAHSGLGALKALNTPSSQKMSARDNAIWDSLMKDMGY